MRDTKSLSLLLLSSVLFLLSIILLCTWGYQYYHQIQEDKSKAQVAKVAPPTVPDSTRDSLLKIYQVTMNSLDQKADSTSYAADSLKGTLDNNLKEFYRLKNEIAMLLQAKTPNVDDLNLARKKITELQQRVQELRFRNTDVEAENKRLHDILEQLSKESQGTDQNVKQVSQENKTLATKVNSIVAISAVNLNLAALANNDSKETNEAKATEKLVGSFTVKNTGNTSARCDIVVVVLQPDGQVLQKSAWESGTFETRDGKRIYSCKIRCDAPQGEAKQLNFSISADSYQKGNYTMQLYHNGVIIGKMYKTLS
jgi:regulator of replication initiation timing